MALDLGDPHHIGLAMAMETTSLAAYGSLKKADSLLRRAQELPDKYPGNRFFAAGVDGIRGFTLYLKGYYRAGYEALTRAEQQFQEIAGATFPRNNVNVFRVFCLRQLGDFKKLGVVIASLCRDAERRGDIYLGSTVRRNGSRFHFLARNRPDDARDELNRSTWSVSETTYHLQDWFELEARSEIALYAGESALSNVKIRQSFYDLEHSLILRVKIIRVLSQSLRGRLLLADSSDSSRLRQVAKIADRIEREGIGVASVHAHLLRAAVANQRGRQDTVAAEFRKAITAAKENEMAFHLAAARLRLGQVLGGDEGAALLAESNDWMAQQEIVDAERMCEMVAPGFSKT